MDIAGLTSHRRLTASHRTHFRHRHVERDLQAGKQGRGTQSRLQLVDILRKLGSGSGASYHSNSCNLALLACLLGTPIMLVPLCRV